MARIPTSLLRKRFELWAKDWGLPLPTPGAWGPAGVFILAKEYRGWEICEVTNNQGGERIVFKGSAGALLDFFQGCDWAHERSEMLWQTALNGQRLAHDLAVDASDGYGVSPALCAARQLKKYVRTLHKLPSETELLAEAARAVFRK